MRASDLARITAFEHRFARAQASDVVELPWGYAVRNDRFPFSEYNNRIRVTSTAPAPEVMAAADEALGGAGLPHRYVSADDAVGEALHADLVAAGYAHETIVTMRYAGHGVEPGPHEVRAVSLETLRPSIIREWRANLPDASDDQLAQLADRVALYASGAALTLLAVFDGGEVAAHADLCVDRIDRIAQFENLVTHEELRGRGYADALLRDALRRAQVAGSELTFLTAGEDDWPRSWYQRFGFVDVGRTHHFVRRE